MVWQRVAAAPSCTRKGYNMIKIYKASVTPLQFISIGFVSVILLGTALLMLPFASRNGEPISFLNAIFMATSATCVTGLSVFDTYTQFTLFGQAVILCLIQVGGLGFMTIGVFLSMSLGKRIGLRERSLMKESISALKIGGIVRLVRRAVFGTLLIEALGVVLLAFRFCPDFGLWDGLWFSVFHSISAFCNAGFDLMGRVAPSQSLSPYAQDALVNLVIMALIVVGGIGFIVWDDILDQKWHIKQYRLQTKIVLAVTLIFIFGGALGFYLLEADHAFAGMPTGEKILASFFQSVSPRTAGFATVDMSTLSESGTFLTIFLMLVGASPGSTGGGIKTTTFFVMIFSVIAYVRSREEINVFNRKIEDKAVQRAYNSTMLYLMAAVLGTLMITLQGVSLDAALFEAVSAIGTVGLSTGITAGLNGLSKVVVILLMYLGRLGSLSVLMAVTDRRIKTKISNVEEKIMIG